ncbi:MAG: hypothetical protein ACRCYO_19290 [Bacteroidia bacterium]
MVVLLNEAKEFFSHFADEPIRWLGGIVVLIIIGAASIAFYKLRSTRSLSKGRKAIDKLRRRELLPQQLTQDYIFVASEIPIAGIALPKISSLCETLVVGSKLFNWEIAYMQAFGNDQLLIGVIFTREELLVVDSTRNESTKTQKFVWLEIRPEAHRKLICIYSEMYRDNEERSNMKRCGEAILREVEKFRI